MNIGNLVIELSANVARLSSDMAQAKREVAGAMKDIRESAETAKHALELLGVGLGLHEFKEMISGAIEAQVQLGHLSEKVGISVQQLSGYRLAAAASGMTIEDMANGVKKLSTFMVSHNEQLRAAGITAKTSNGALMQIADMFRSMPDGVQKTALAVALFGRNGLAMIPMLNEGSLAIQQWIDKGNLLNPITAESAKQAKEFHERLVELQAASSAIGTSIANDMLPWLLKTATALSDVAISAKSVKTAMASWALTSGDESDNPGKAINEITGALERQKKLLAEMQATDHPVFNFDEMNTLKAGIAMNEAKLPYLKSLQRQQALEGSDSYRDEGAGNKGPNAKFHPEGLLPQSEEAKKAKAEYDALIKTLTDKTAAQQAELDSDVKLNEAQKAHVTYLAQEHAGLLKMTPAEKASADAYWATYLSVAKLNQEKKDFDKSEAAALKRAADNYDAQEKEIQGIKDETERQREHNAELRYGADAMTQLKAARIDDQIAREESLLLSLSELPQDAKEIQQIREKIEALKELKGEREAEVGARAIEKQRNEWKQFSDQIEQSLTDALMRGFEDGKNFGRNFVDTLKHTLETAALKLVIQTVVSPMFGNNSGLLGSASSGINGAGSAFNPLSGFTSNGFGMSIANGAQWLSSGSSMGPAAPGSIGSMFAGAGQYSNFEYGLAGIGGNFIGSKIGGQMGGTLGGIGGTIGMAMGGPMGAVAGSVIGGAVGGLIGGHHDDPHNNADSSGVSLRLNRRGVFGSGSAITDEVGGATPYSWVEGQTSGHGRWNDGTALTQSQISAIAQSTAALFASGHDLARLLGVDPSVIDSAQVANARFASVQAALTSLSNVIVGDIIPGISKFKQAGETLTATAQRLAGELQLTDQIAQMVGRSSTQMFGASGVKSIGARDDLIAKLGGTDTASSTLSSFFQNFYSDAERNKAATASISATLQGLGVSVLPETREQFRSLVEAQDLSTDAGRKMYAALVAVSSAFAGVTASADAAAAALSSDPFATLVDYERAQAFTAMGIKYSVTSQGASIPAFADGGLHQGGWAMYGENGPELAYSPASRVYSNPQSRQLLDTSSIVGELKATRKESKAVAIALAGFMLDMSKRVRKWDGDGIPSTRTY